MNYIWGVMIVTGIVYGTLSGQLEAVSDSVLSSAKEAVSLCVTMLGIMAFWTGLMEIAKESGLVHSLSEKIRPLLRLLFPRIPKDHPAYEHISMNCVANFLGLGWAATPAGLKAMEALADLEEECRQEGERKTYKEEDNRQIKSRGRNRQKQKIRTGAVPVGIASNEMCNFLILNISSLQLIPVSVIAYRSQYGSANPAAITGPAIAATAVSTGVGIIFCLLMNTRYKKTGI